MGGKKKKGLTTRLTKMSDEERARYLQHRAAIEEEAKRRKEQLIATYMKNKLKKEEAFTRLNIAKINEHWHQILRKVKVKELKTEIEDLRIWIGKVIEIKNSVITRLMKEIEESEEQYQHHLRRHLSHIDYLIEFENGYQNKLKNEYDKELALIEEHARKELDCLIRAAKKEHYYLRTIIFGMQTNFNKETNLMKTFRDSKLEEYCNSLKAEFGTMVKTYNMTMEKIWRDINTILREYLVRTTVQRHHYIELKHLDDRNTADRLDNERRITRYTDLTEKLQNDYDIIYKTNETEIENLKETKQVLNKQLEKLKRELTKSIRKDEKILKNMTTLSTNTIKYLDKILEKGKNIKKFITCCKRLETENEQMLAWAKMHGLFDQFDENIENLKHSETDSKENGSETTTDKDFTLTEIDSSDNITTIGRKTSLEECATEELPKEFDNLKKLENILWCCNRVEVECMELKCEKQKLIAENENMKKIIKNILRDAALEPPPPKEMSFPIKTIIKSAPPMTNKINMHGLSFITIDL